MPSLRYDLTHRYLPSHESNNNKSRKEIVKKKIQKIVSYGFSIGIVLVATNVFLGIFNIHPPNINMEVNKPLRNLILMLSCVFFLAGATTLNDRSPKYRKINRQIGGWLWRLSISENKPDNQSEEYQYGKHFYIDKIAKFLPFSIVSIVLLILMLNYYLGESWTVAELAIVYIGFSVIINALSNGFNQKLIVNDEKMQIEQKVLDIILHQIEALFLIIAVIIQFYDRLNIPFGQVTTFLFYSVMILSMVILAEKINVFFSFIISAIHTRIKNRV